MRICLAPHMAVLGDEVHGMGIAQFGARIEDVDAEASRLRT